MGYCIGVVIKPSLTLGRYSSLYFIGYRVAAFREKYLENEIIFQIREKSAYFVDGQGHLERTLKVREFKNK